MAILFGIILLGLVLVLAGRIIMDSVKRLVARSPLRKFGLVVVLMSLIAVLPELLIGVAAYIEGVSVLTLGVVLGINIINISLVVGGVALIGGTIPVVGDFNRREMLVALTAGVAPIVMLVDGSLSRTDGWILLLYYFFYVWRALVVKRREQKLTKGRAEHAWVGQIKNRPTEHWQKLLVKLTGSLALLVIASFGIVRLSVNLVEDFRLSLLIVSFVLVAVGMSLPEVMLEAVAARRRQVALVFGDILGLIVANSTLVLGLSVVVAPMEQIFVPSIILMGVGFVSIFGLFWLFVSSKRKLSRGEGLTLIGIYLIFLGLELLLD